MSGGSVLRRGGSLGNYFYPIEVKDTHSCVFLAVSLNSSELGNSDLW